MFSLRISNFPQANLHIYDITFRVDNKISRFPDMFQDQGSRQHEFNLNSEGGKTMLSTKSKEH